MYIVVCHSYDTLICHLYVLLCRTYVIRICSYVILMAFLCTRMSFICHSYVLAYHSYVTCMYSYVVYHLHVVVCHSYVFLPWTITIISSLLESSLSKLFCYSVQSLERLQLQKGRVFHMLLLSIAVIGSGFKFTCSWIIFFLF